jgi:hypothetical protein
MLRRKTPENFMENAPREFADVPAAGSRVSAAKARRDGLYLLVLGCSVFLLFGLALMPSTEALDFEDQYYTAQTLLRHGDPYDQKQVLQVFNAVDANSSADSFTNRMIVTRTNYLPTAFPVTIAFAMLPYWLAHWLWMSLTAGSLIVAAFLIWREGAQYAPALSGALVGYLLASNIFIWLSTNPAGISIGLCVIAAWCFLRNRYIAIGVFCFAIALMLKPHDVGLVWLYFLFAKTVRKPALLSSLLVIALTIPVITWLAYATPHWASEWRSNLQFYAMPGGMNDPSPAAGRGSGMDRMINLQTATSLLSDNPHVYNAIAYLICGVLLLIWLAATVRARRSVSGAYLGLAAASVLTMLPVYHRQNDAILLLLAIPACAKLWAESRQLGRSALAFTFAALYITGALPWVFVTILNSYYKPAVGFASRLLATTQLLSVPIILLAMAIFYLWTYLSSATRAPVNVSDSELVATEAP